MAASAADARRRAAPPTISAQASASAGVAGATPAADQNERRQHRRGVGRDPEQADVAVLDAMVPDIEGEADGAEAEAEDREPLAGVRRNDRRLERGVTERRERRRGEAEPATASVGAPLSLRDSTE